MTRDIEEQLRRSLAARASDVTPDAALYSRVQSRIRRGRNVRFAFAGLATALAVTGVALAGPALMDRRVEFEPGPVATQPAPDPTVEATQAPSAVAAAEFVFTDGETVWGHRADGSTEELIPSPCPPDSMCDMDPISGVAALPGAAPGPGTSVASAGCGGLRYADHSGEIAEIPVAGEAHCTFSPVFSPDGQSLAWAATTSKGWSVQTVDWTGSAPGDDDAAFALPWPERQPVDIQEWVWTETTGSTTKGYLVVRTQRDGAWMLLQIPIERQGDGALALTLRPAPITAMADDLTPVAFASGGGDYSREQDVTYTMELNMAPDGISAGRVVARMGAEGAGVVDLPPELFGNDAFDVADLWMSAHGDTLVLGNAGQRSAWRIDWSEITAEPVLLDIDSPEQPGEDVVHADLVPPATSPSAEPSEAPTRSVDVYFSQSGKDECVADQPVSREVTGAGVARAALNELLQGPSSRESNEGIVSPFNAVTAGSLNDIRIAKGEARVDFDDFSSKLGDDACTKSAVLDALDKTLKQFPTITSTRYSFDGDAGAFRTWMDAGSAQPVEVPAPVRRTAEKIRAAAEARDYDALEELMRDEFSCSLSDQPEDCVTIWKDQEANGEDPLGALAEILREEPAPSDGTWFWPERFLGGTYDGPRTGIGQDGTWYFFQYKGG